MYAWLVYFCRSYPVVIFSRFVSGGHKKDPATKAFEISYPIADTFQHLGSFIAALRISVGIRAVKGMQNIFTPVVDGTAAAPEFRKICELRYMEPVL